MALPPPDYSWVLLNRMVMIYSDSDGVATIPVEDVHKWKVMQWKSREAYECGADGGSVVAGLTLLVRVEPPPELSTLRIHVNDDVVRAKGSRLGVSLLTTDKGLAVIHVSIGPYGSNIYYLVCDVAASSLTLVPSLEVCSSRRGLSWLKPWPAYSIGRVVPPKCGAGAGGPALVTLAAYHSPVIDGLPTQHLVFLWPLSPPPSSAGWQRKTPIFPDLPPESLGVDGFWVHDGFSFEGKIFFVDLLEGVLYCDHDDLLSNSSDEVQFHYIALPPESMPDHDVKTAYWDYPPHTWRAMAGVGGSIKFVSIGSVCHNSTGIKFLDTRTVTMWTLSHDLKEWEEEMVIRMHHTCGYDGLDPYRRCSCIVLSPILRPDDPEANLDAHLSSDDIPELLYLGLQELRYKEVFIFCIDMNRQATLQKHRLSPWVNLCSNKITGSSFFECLDSQSLAPLKRKFVDDSADPEIDMHDINMD